ncbi:PD-(D/E)XK nuclease family protein [Saccharothrix stipae]
MVPRKPEVLESFTNGPFMKVMDLVEHRGLAADRALQRIVHEPGDGGVHDSIRQWTTHAVSGYMKAFSTEVDESLAPYRGQWTYESMLPHPDQRGAKQYRITVWGRCYSTRDGRVREVRLLVNRLSSRQRTDAEIAVAALVLASGDPANPPDWIRIRQFGILEGEAVTLFDGSRQAALDLYDVAGKRALAQIVDAGDPVDYRPGTVCADCPFSAVCPALQRVPGLLGVQDRRRPRRSWSATSARNHAKCPALDYARRQRLPVDQTVERGRAAERGRAIHRYLERRHQAPGPPCGARVSSEWVPEGFRLLPEDQELGVTLLQHHAAVCPLRLTRLPDDLRVEPELVYEDSDADTVVLAKPDLIYHDGESWVWREVKTSIVATRGTRPWFQQYPQLALATVLASRGNLGPGLGRVELEILRPAGVDLVTFDPHTTEVRRMAEEVLRQSFQRWHTDDRFQPEPGPQCADCEMARWCSAKQIGRPA